MAKVEIGDGDTEVGVTKDQELLVSVSPYPAIREVKARPFRKFLTVDGAVGGSNDMGIDGSSTNVDFAILASSTDDRYLTSLSILVGYGTSGQPNQWANGTALSNGMKLFYESIRGEVVLHEGIKSNQDMFRLYFGLIPTNWEVRHVNANNDFGYMFGMDMEKITPQFGVKLDAGSNQRLVMRVRDNAGTDADSFNVIAYGFDRFE